MITIINILKIKFSRKKLRVHSGYINNLKNVDHLTSGYPILAKNEYLMKHYPVYAHLY